MSKPGSKQHNASVTTPLRKRVMILLSWVGLWLKKTLTRLWGAVPGVKRHSVSPGVTDTGSGQVDSEWKTNEALCTYPPGGGEETTVTVQTSSCAFHVDLGRLSECSEYFRALSRSTMRETSESLVHLEHVSSSVFRNLLEFSFLGQFNVPQEELGTHIQVSSYLLAEAFLSRCLSVLADKLSPGNCLSYLNLAREICCLELKMTVFTYLSRNLLELPHLVTCLTNAEKDKVVQMRKLGDKRLCSLRKENLTSWSDPETERARHVFSLKELGDGGGDWHPITELPFAADKWCFTAVVLHNYLYILGGHRQPVKRGWEFKMASFRYNPFTHSWFPTAPLIKHRRHFSAVACEGCIYAVGGWYLDSLVTPDSNTALYTAVECYDPWEDTWRFVSSLPLNDFTVSLSHDVPLATGLGHCLYVLGSIQRTGEKLLLQYDTRRDSWCELLPTLTRAAADLPALYFLGATDRLHVIGGNNSSNVVTSFCVQSQKWGQVHTAEKVGFAGQGTVADKQVFMPSIEHNSVARMDLQTLSLRVLPPLPISTRYEAVFYLHF
ncbi:kelch repeat and BTB domain-containing protein 11 isoform X2 [Gasterosteus aculeatus]